MIFILGFLQGAAIGFLLSLLSLQLLSPQELVLSLFVAVVCGCICGVFFLACYFVVIFCAGCQCGVATFVLLAVAFSYNIVGHVDPDCPPTQRERREEEPRKKSEKDPPQNKTRAAHRQPNIDVLLRCKRNFQ